MQEQRKHGEGEQGAVPKSEEANAPELEACSLGRVAHTSKLDPDMKAGILTRSDHTMRIQYPTGDSLVLWPDGSRTTTMSDGSWVVEADGLPCVRGNPAHMRCQISMDTTLTWRAAGASIELDQGQGPILVAANGISCSSALLARAASTWHATRDLAIPVGIWKHILWHY